MFEANNKQPLTKEFVLSRVSEEDIFMKYMSIYPTLNQKYKSPLRDDNRAGCSFYRDSRGVLKFVDPAYKINIDCFNLVSLVHSEANNFNKALKRIAEDFGIYEKEIDYSIIANWKEAIEKAKDKFTLINVKRKDFTKDELKWWQEQGIYKEVLDFYKIASVQMVWLNGNLIYNYTKKDPAYVYHFGDYNYKVYFPLRQQYRFIQNIRSNTAQGFIQLPEGGDILVITKSLKDVACLHGFGIPAIAPSSETTLMPESIMLDISNRFTYIFTLFDRDRSGLHMTWLMRKKYNTIPLLFESKNKLFRDKEEPKDFTDNLKIHGTSYMIDLIEETKQIIL